MSSPGTSNAPAADHAADRGSGAGASGAADQLDPSTEDLLSTLPPGPRAHTPTSAPGPPAAAEREEPEDDRRAEVEPPPAEGAPAPTSIEMRAPAREDSESSRGGQGMEAVVGPYVIQVGAVSDPAAAARRAQEARAAAPDQPVAVRRQDGWLTVFVGSFASREEGEAARRELSARGLGVGWVTRVSQ